MGAFVFSFAVFGVGLGDLIDHEGQQDCSDYDRGGLHVTCLGWHKWKEKNCRWSRWCEKRKSISDDARRSTGFGLWKKKKIKRLYKKKTEELKNSRDTEKHFRTPMRDKKKIG